MSAIEETKKLLREKIRQFINEKVFPGCVFGVSIKGKERFIVSEGRYTYDDNSPLVKDDTIYDVASVTKSIPTSTLLLQLADQTKIKLDDKLADYIPEFNNNIGKDKVTIKHLLTYTLNLTVPATSSLKDLSPDDIIKAIVEAPLRNEPGSSFIYTNSTAMLMGLLIKKITGIGVDVLAQEKLFKPLGMTSTTFYPEKLNSTNIPPTEIDESRGGIVQGIVHDESTYAIQPKYYLGVAGLFSTVPDLLTILEVFRDRGAKNGTRYLSEEIIEQINTNQFENLKTPTGLGWQLKSPQWEYFGSLSSPKTFGQTGFTGCHVVCDPKKNIVIAMLSNRTFPKRPPTRDAINKARRELSDIAYRNLISSNSQTSTSYTTKTLKPLHHSSIT